MDLTWLTDPIAFDQIHFGDVTPYTMGIYKTSAVL